MVKDVTKCLCGVHHVTSLSVQHALGLARGARGVQDEQRILGIHHLSGCSRCETTQQTKDGKLVLVLVLVDKRPLQTSQLCLT